MADVAFYVAPRRVWLAWVGLVLIVLASVVVYENDPLAAVLLLVAFGVLIVRGLLRRSRPLVAVSGDILTWRSMIGIRWSGTIPLEEVTPVDLEYLWYLVLQTRSGKRRWINVSEIEKSQRKAVRDAIAQRLRPT